MSGRTVDKTSTSWRKLAGFLATFAAVSCSSTTAKPTRSATPAATQQEWSRFQSSKGNAPPDDAVVHVISRGVGCSGTLITNNLVLTAHHCMVERNANGDILEEDLPASELEVEVDGDSRPSMVPVLAAVAPPCGYRGGNGDIAVLVLSRRVMGRSTMPVRLSDPPQTGEVIEPLGYGHCSLSSEGNHRVRHLGGPIEELGPFAISAPAAICPGDSGGPAQSSLTGEAVGVVSAGIMDDSDQTRDQATFTRLDVWRPLFARARMIAEGSSPAEVPPIAACAAN